MSLKINLKKKEQFFYYLFKVYLLYNFLVWKKNVNDAFCVSEILISIENEEEKKTILLRDGKQI